MHDKILDAIEFAMKAHEGQKRKYTGEPYIVHPLEVACIVAEYNEDPWVIMAAILHDVVEDCDVTFNDIGWVFGLRVAQYVGWLTDVSRPSDGKRSIRKRLDCEHISIAPMEARMIKVADLIHNTSSITEHDPSFAKLYMSEKRLLLKYLGYSAGKYKEIMDRACKQVSDYFDKEVANG